MLDYDRASAEIEGPSSKRQALSIRELAQQISCLRNQSRPSVLMEVLGLDPSQSETQYLPSDFSNRLEEKIKRKRIC